MGVYIKNTETYTIKYNKNNLKDLKGILNDILHYFWADYNEFEYISDQDIINKKYENEEYGYNIEDRVVKINEEDKTLSIFGIYEREHGEGTHLEIDKDFLFEKLFEYDSNIIIIEEDENLDDAGIDDYDKYSMIVYMIDGKIKVLRIENPLDTFIFDEIIDKSDLKYFTIIDNENEIRKNIKNISNLNVDKYYKKYKEYLTEEDIVELVKKDFQVITLLEKEIINKIVNNKELLYDCIKNMDLLDLEDLDFDGFDIDDIINNKSLLLTILNNSKKEYYIDELVEANEIIQIILDKYSEDKDIIISLISHYNYDYNNISNKLKCDKEILIEAVKVKPYFLKYASNDLRDDENLLIELMKINPKVYQFASKRLIDIYKPKREKKTIRKEKTEENGKEQLTLFDDELVF